MQSVILPELTGLSFASILFELYIANEDIPEKLCERLNSWFSTYQGPLKVRRSSREIATLRSAYGSGWMAELQIERESFENCDADAPGNDADIAGLLDLLSGVHTNLSVSAAYAVPREVLPPRGIVNQIIGVKTSVSGENLLLTGARFSLRDATDDYVSWFLSRRGEISGTVVRHITDLFHHNSLVDAAGLAESSLQTLILEHHPSGSTNGRNRAPA